MKVNIYLTFDGDCAAAFNFYKEVFGGEFSWRATFGDSPMKDKVPPDMLDRIMHVSLPLGDNMDLMGCDYYSTMQKTSFVKGTNKQISLSPDTKDEADRLFEVLSKGGSADQPLELMFWGSYFGCLTDPFGIKWMIDCGVNSDDKTEIQKAVKEMQSISTRATSTALALEKLLTKMGKGPACKKPKL
jgi:PhnB protein